MRGFFEYLERLTPPVVGLSSFIAGVLLAAGSVLVGVDSLRSPSGKEIGYFSQINWFVNYVVFVPGGLYFFVATLRCVPNLLEELRTRGMLLGRDEAATSLIVLRDRWKESLVPAGRWAVALSLIATLASIWLAYLASPFLRVSSIDAMRPPPQDWEIFWAWAALLAPDRVNWLANLVFNLAAYMAQAIIVSTILSFLVITTTVSSLMERLANDQAERTRLIPNVRSNDSRRGFELFEQFMEYVLLASACFFLACFCTRLELIYQKSPEAISMGDFLVQRLVVGFKDVSLSDLAGARDVIFDIGGPGVSPPEAFTFLGVLAAGVVAVLSVIYNLRRAAQASRAHYVALIEANDPAAIRSLAPVTREEALARLQNMTFWPIHWGRLNEIVLWLAFAVICFLWYRLALLVLAYGIWIVVKQVWQRLRRPEVTT